MVVVVVVKVVVARVVVLAVLGETGAVEAAAAFVLLASAVASPVEGTGASSLESVVFVGVATVGSVIDGPTELVSEVKSPHRMPPRPSVRSPRPKRACRSGGKGDSVAEKAGSEEEEEEGDDGDVMLVLLLLLLEVLMLLLLLLLVVVPVRKVLGGEGVMAPVGACVPWMNKV